MGFDPREWRERSLAVFVVAGLLVGALVAPVAVGLVDRDRSVVAVVPIEGAIDGETANRTTAQLREARTDPSVEAVVLLVNSPGGAASASESQYLAVRRLAAEKPVVASVDALAASGAYYTILPSERIFVKPSSIVGSVGVIATLPREVEPNDRIVSTGPNKLAADSEREFKYTVETLKRAFANAVMAHRGEELTISRAAVTEAGTFSGTVAVRNGMADAVGGTGTAIAYAAEQAGIEEYSVRYYRGNGTARFVSRAAYVASDAPDKELLDPAYLTGVGARGTAAGNYLMIPPRFAYPGSRTDGAASDRSADGNGTADRQPGGASGTPAGAVSGQPAVEAGEVVARGA